MKRNPFQYQTEVTGPSFIDRTEDLATLRRHCINGRNIILVAPRRLGKSSLIQETFRRLPANVLPLYVDISKTGQEGDVAQRILTALAAKAFGRVERAWRWILDHFRRTRPIVRAGPDGPEFSFEVADAGLPELEETLGLLEATARRQKKRIVLAIDEFQKIVERDKTGETIGAIRGIVQHQSRVSYIFSGSKKHTLLGLVEDRNEPFWGQLDTMEIGGIPIHHFAPLAKRLFKKAGHPIDDATLGRVGELCFDNPKRIQELLAGLFDAGQAPTAALATEILARQIHDRRHHLEDILNDVEEGHQKRLVLALAKEGRPTRITTRQFMTRHHLGGPGFVERAADSLRKKGILTDRNWFVDPYFFHYLGDGA